jgi:hypothetical protein
MADHAVVLSKLRCPHPALLDRFELVDFRATAGKCAVIFRVLRPIENLSAAVERSGRSKNGLHRKKNVSCGEAVGFP